MEKCRTMYLLCIFSFYLSCVNKAQKEPSLMRASLNFGVSNKARWMGSVLRYERHSDVSKFFVAFWPVIRKRFVQQRLHAGWYQAIDIFFSLFFWHLRNQHDWNHANIARLL